VKFFCKRQPKIFLDACVLKASVDTISLFRKEKRRFNWAGREVEVDAHRPVYFNQNAAHLGKNDTRFIDTIDLRWIAAWARDDKVRLVTHYETWFEFLSLPRTLGDGPVFWGAPIDHLHGVAPVERAITSGENRERRHRFFCRIEDRRFLEIQKAVGAFQGESAPRNVNRLADAYHLWCAEHAAADFFLTIDDRLINSLANSKKFANSVVAITPSQQVRKLLVRRPAWIWSAAKEKVRLDRSGRDLYAVYQDGTADLIQKLRDDGVPIGEVSKEYSDPPSAHSPTHKTPS
jgi:hypothetical protein